MFRCDSFEGAVQGAKGGFQPGRSAISPLTSAVFVNWFPWVMVGTPILSFLSRFIEENPQIFHKESQILGAETAIHGAGPGLFRPPFAPGQSNDNCHTSAGCGPYI